MTPPVAGTNLPTLVEGMEGLAGLPVARINLNPLARTSSCLDRLLPEEQVHLRHTARYNQNYIYI